MIDRVDVRRRRVLAALAGAPLLGLALAGCSEPARPGKRGVTGPDATPDVRVRWAAARWEGALLTVHALVLERHADLRDSVQPFTEHHREHLDALIDDGPLPLLARVGDDTAEADGHVPEPIASAIGVTDIPGDRDDALEVIRAAEHEASAAHVTACLRATGSRLAALLASLAAAEAVHHSMLEPR